VWKGIVLAQSSSKWEPARLPIGVWKTIPCLNLYSNWPPSRTSCFTWFEIATGTGGLKYTVSSSVFMCWREKSMYGVSGLITTSPHFPWSHTIAVTYDGVGSLSLYVDHAFVETVTILVGVMLCRLVSIQLEITIGSELILLISITTLDCSETSSASPST